MKSQTYKKKRIIFLLAMMITSISFIIILARYVTTGVNNFFLRSKEFYFFSDKLSENLEIFQIENWSGVDDYTITINMNSRKNNLEVASYDIEYDIEYSCSNNAICQVSKTSGNISSVDNTDFFNVTITPNTQLQTGDKVVVYITATSKTEYVKQLKGRFTFVVGKENLTYQITDKSNSPYAELSVTNTLTYYTVEEAFGTYQKGYKIDFDTYLALTEEEKSKCYSGVVLITFDPRVVLLDNTSETYQNAISTTTQTIDDKEYINSITLSIEAISSVNVRFYKVDTSQDYTYPNNDNFSIVTVTQKEGKK